jgi:hypothetical protein
LALQTWPATSAHGFGPLHECSHGLPESSELEAWIWLATRGQRVLAVSHAEILASTHVLQNRRYAARVRVHLYPRPREIIETSGVFSFDAYKIGVAISQALPVAHTGMVAPAGRDEVVRPISAQPDLRQRTCKIGASVNKQLQARHVSGFRSCRMVAHDAKYLRQVTIAAALPALNRRDLETGAVENRQ